MSITRIKVRAEVAVGGISVVTPYVQSFNVRKQRGQISTFDATLKIPYGTSTTLAGGDVVISAGTDNQMTTIFTGMCRFAKISPCYDDPAYVILSISGSDKLALLQGKKFTRRCRATNATWCSITGVTRHGLKSGKFAYDVTQVININPGQTQNQSTLTATVPTASAVEANKPAPAPTGDSGVIRKPVASIKIKTNKDNT
jgi:hypothetical protein